MKKRLIFLGLLVIVSFFVFADESCDLDVSLLNQDPYPAVPGEKTEVVFAISNIDSSACGEIYFEVLEDYPFKIEEGSKKSYTIQSGTFTKDYNTQKMIPIDLIVDKEALDGDTPIEVRYRYSKSPSIDYISKSFNIKIEDVRADFESFVSSYNYNTKEMTIEILNIGENDIEAVTVEIPKQKGVKVYGANKKNVGDLSSNEDTSADFKLDVNSDKIKIIITYSDEIQVRRKVEKEIEFDSDLFIQDDENKKTNYWMWATIILVILILGRFFLKKKRKKK